MELRWTSKALSDLTRLYGFLATVNKAAAARTVQALTGAAGSLISNPRIGERLEEFEPREIRRILVGRYNWPIPCHTTRHAGLHRAVRVVEVRTGEVLQVGRNSR